MTTYNSEFFKSLIPAFENKYPCLDDAIEALGAVPYEDAMDSLINAFLVEQGVPLTKRNKVAFDKALAAAFDWE